MRATPVPLHPARAPQRRSAETSVLARLIRSQVVNASRSVAVLRPFKPGEFGSGAASPSAAHIRAANGLLGTLQKRLYRGVNALNARAQRRKGAPSQLEPFLAYKETLERDIKSVERIWAFYFELFNQRQSRFGEMLLGLDRMALDCYSVLYTGLDVPRSVPSPAPFSFMETERTPSTYRRGVKLSKLGKRANPFPIVQLPIHRLINPWTLGAVHHEVSHNLQSDLGLWNEVPKRIGENLGKAGLPPGVGSVWQRWHKEIWADLCGLLLGGPAVAQSLFDVLLRSPARVQRFNPSGVHPAPYLRALINLELLRRTGFQREADALARAWQQLYPSARRGNLPSVMLKSFGSARRLVVQTICFEPYEQLGNKSLVEVVTFKPSHQAMVKEAASRVAVGTDPGIIPERFFVAVAREALEQNYARPETVRHNIYRALVRR